MLGIDPQTVEVVHCDRPRLSDMVLVDCPDPDTTEDPQNAGDQSGPTQSVWCRIATCCWLLPRSRNTAAPGWQMNWPPRRRGRAGAGANARRSRRRHSATDWPKDACAAYNDAGHVFFVRFTGRPGRRPGRTRAARRVGPAVGTAHPTPGRNRRQSHPPGEFPLDLADRHAPDGRHAESTRLCPPSRNWKPRSWNSGPRCGPAVATNSQRSCFLSRRHWESRVVTRIASRWGSALFR